MTVVSATRILLSIGAGLILGDVRAFAPFITRSSPSSYLTPPTAQILPLVRLRETTIEEGYEKEMQDLQQNIDIANKEASKSEERIQELTSMVGEAQQKLVAAQQELKDGQESWGKKKTRFVQQITELTDVLNMAGGGRKRMDDEAKAEALKRQKELEQDVKNYSSALEQAQEELQMERGVANELKERLLNAEDSLEFEQMRFEKEKDELTQMIDAEKAKLVDVSNRFEDQKKKYQREKSDFERKIERETSRVEEAETKLERVRSEFEKTQRELRKEMSVQQEKLRNMDAKLTSESVLRREERAVLELQLAQETEKLQRAERQLYNDRKLFEQVKSDLEDRISVEKRRVGVLSKQLEVEQQRFASTKERLESTIVAEQAKLTEVQTQLEQEQIQFKKEKDVLEKKIDDGVRDRKLKAKQMNKRYETIRTEMNDLYEGAKRDARNERRYLTEKYSSQIGELTGTIQSLESDLAASQEATRDLKAQIESYELAKKQFIEERQRMEKNYTTEIGKKNEVIVSLRQNVDALQNDVRVRDETIELYQSSFREIFGLGRQLSKKRLRKVGSRLRRPFRRD